MFLFTAILFVLLTHLQFIGLLMMGGALIAAVALFVTRPTTEGTPSTIGIEDAEKHTDHEEHEDDEYDYPQAA